MPSCLSPATPADRALGAARRQLVDLVAAQARGSGGPGALAARIDAAAALRAAAAAADAAPQDTAALAAAVARKVPAGRRAAARDLMAQALCAPAGAAERAAAVSAGVGAPRDARAGAPRAASPSAPTSPVAASQPAAAVRPPADLLDLLDMPAPGTPLSLLRPHDLARLALVSKGVRRAVEGRVPLQALRRLHKLESDCSKYLFNEPAGSASPYLDGAQGAQLSPGGRWVQRWTATFRGEVVSLVDPQARGAVRPLPFGDRPVWSPNERRMALAGTHETSVYDLERCEAPALTVPGRHPRFSADGARVGVLSDASGGHATFTVYNIGEASAEPLAAYDTRRALAAHLISPAPSLLRLAFVDHGRHLLHIDTLRGPRGAAPGDRPAPSRRTLDLLGGEQSISALHWTPNSRHLVVEASVAGGRSALLTVDVRTGRTAWLSSTLQRHALSPDGALVALVHGPHAARFLGVKSIFGESLWCSPPHGIVDRLAWSGDSTLLHSWSYDSRGGAGTEAAHLLRVVDGPPPPPSTRLQRLAGVRLPADVAYRGAPHPDADAAETEPG